jgi:hypothetical protein
MKNLERNAITNNGLGIAIADKLDEIVNNINNTTTNIARIKHYIAYLTQTVTNAPIADIRIDDLGSPVWSRIAAGKYHITKVGMFIENCVSVTQAVSPTKPDMFTDGNGNGYTLEWINTDVLELNTYAASDLTISVDNILVNRYINIEVYINK